MSRMGRRSLGVFLVGLMVTAGLLAGQSTPGASTGQTPDEILATEGYVRPPAVIEKVVAAARHLNVSLTGLSPDYKYFVNAQTDGMPKLADFARPHYNLAGFQVDPAANRNRSLTQRGASRLFLISSRDGRTTTVETPANAKISSPQWSPNGTRLAFLASLPNATHLYVADPATGRSEQVTRTPVLATHITSFEWLADSEHIVLVVLPANAGPAPKEPAVAPTPIVRLSTEGETRTRMLFRLLETPWEMQLLEYYSTGQIVRLNVRTRAVTPIGQPAMVQGLDVAPDGQHVRVQLLKKPFSYIVQLRSFPSADEIWDQNGGKLLTLTDRPLNLPGTPAAAAITAAAATAPRNVTWRPDGPGITFLQRQAGSAPPPQNGARGGGRGSAAQQQGPDQVVHWLPPFNENSRQVIYTNDNPISSVRYSPDGRTLFVTEATRNQPHLFAVSLDVPNTKHTISRGTTAGTLLTKANAQGESVARMSADGQFVFLLGSGAPATEEDADPDAPPAEAAPAPRPFMDKVSIKTGEKTRLFEANGDRLERITDLLKDDVTEVIISRESRSEPPNFFYRNLVTGDERKLTNNIDHTPELQRIQTRTHMVTRADGYKFRMTVSLPLDYREGTRYPAMFWIYPREYTSQAAYDRTLRNNGTTNRFTTPSVSSIRLLTLLGYVVVEPDVPIFGPEGRMNDNYIQDLRNDHAAIIDELDRLGYIDRNRIGLGGHSYGGSSTLNSMVHTPFFKAGIAGDSNSNRTLTPTGFQTERRNLWDDRDLYLEVSSLLYANQLNGAVLLYHGQLDQNVGADPIHSKRMFHALNSLGKTAALFMYPYEDHGQATLETRLDMWARWIAWLDKYVKYADRGKGSNN
jgi:dipeptidyl aminopeptidase/acylaminoacyl peptidase